jgi:hypothetical protein
VRISALMINRDGYRGLVGLLAAWSPVGLPAIPGLFADPVAVRLRRRPRDDADPHRAAGSPMSDQVAPVLVAVRRRAGQGSADCNTERGAAPFPAIKDISAHIWPFVMCAYNERIPQDK